MIHGILNLWKPMGPTSHDMVAKLRRILGQKRIGHTGTLDPMAVGILPICLGDATRLAEYFTAQEKEYAMVIRFGYTSDTYDRTGLVQKGENCRVTREEFLKILEGFQGEIDQVPPMYSAISVDGKRLYELARKGVEVERASRRVRIEEIKLLEECPATIEPDSEITVKIRCSKGTYVRSFSHDLGQKVGCGAILMQLERQRNGWFNKEMSKTLSEVQLAIEQEKPEDILFHLRPEHLNLPVFMMNEKQKEDLGFGRPIWAVEQITGPEVVLCHNSLLHAVAMIHLESDGCWLKPKKVLANPVKIETPNTF